MEFTIKISSTNLDKLNTVFQVINQNVDFEILNSKLVLPALSRYFDDLREPVFSDTVINEVRKVIIHQFKGIWFRKRDLVQQVNLVDGPSESTVGKLLSKFSKEGFLETRGSRSKREYLLLETDFADLQTQLQDTRLKQLQQSREGF